MGRDTEEPTKDVASSRWTAPPGLASLLVLGGAFGALFGGVGGVLIAAAGVALAVRLGPRWTATAAVACLVAAAIATVTEAGFPVQWDDFGRTRVVAASLARAAGILAWVAVIAFGERERRGHRAA